MRQMKQRIAICFKTRGKRVSGRIYTARTARIDALQIPFKLRGEIPFSMQAMGFPPWQKGRRIYEAVLVLFAVIAVRAVVQIGL